MARRSSYIALLLLLTAFALLAPRYLARAVDGPLTVAVAQTAVPQGGVAFLTIQAPGATAVRVRDGKVVIPADARGDGVWEAVAAVWMETPPGARALTIEADIDGKTITAPATITVTRRTFPVQRLHMSRDQEAKYAAASVQQEYRLIGAALHRETPRVWHGGLPLPVASRLATRYGTQRYRNGRKVSIHKGVDLSAPEGAPVYAAADGVVALRRCFTMHGHALAIDHGGGVVGLYLHLSAFGVCEGQMVKKGQLIARVGHTGVATGPHLHYALYAHGTAIDPTLFEDVPAGW